MNKKCNFIHGRCEGEVAIFDDAVPSQLSKKEGKMINFSCYSI